LLSSQSLLKEDLLLSFLGEDEGKLLELVGPTNKKNEFKMNLKF